MRISAREAVVTLLLVLCVVVLWAWLVTHVALVTACVRRTSLSKRDRLLALLPPLSPWIGWYAGHKKTVFAWACLFVLYAVLRAALAAR